MAQAEFSLQGNTSSSVFDMLETDSCNFYLQLTSGGHYAIYWGGENTMGVWGRSPKGKFLMTTPFKLSENMGNALFDVFVIYATIALFLCTFMLCERMS